MTDEINPEHPVTQAARDNWHKIAALILFKLCPGDMVEITPADVATFAEANRSIVIRDDGERILVYLVDEVEARMIAEHERSKRK